MPGERSGFCCVLRAQLQDHLLRLAPNHGRAIGCGQTARATGGDLSCGVLPECQVCLQATYACKPSCATMKAAKQSGGTFEAPMPFQLPEAGGSNGSVELTHQPLREAFEPPPWWVTCSSRPGSWQKSLQQSGGTCPTSERSSMTMQRTCDGAPLPSVRLCCPLTTRVVSGPASTVHCLEV